MMRVTPITSTADIERAVTQAATDPEAQWYVTRVAKALGAEDLLPGSWQMEADNISSFRDYRSAEMSQEQNLERAGELVEAVVASAMDQVSGEATFDDVVTLAVSAGIQAEMDSLGEEFEEVLAVTLKSLVAGGHIDADTAALITPGVRGAAFVEAIESGEDGEALTAGILKRIKTAEGAIRYDGQIGEPIRPNEDVDAPDAVPTVEDTTARRGVFRRRPKPAPPAGRQQQSSNRVEDYTVTPGPTEPNVPDNAVRVNPDTGESLTNTPSTPRNSAPTTPAGVPEFNERDFNARIDARAAAQEAEKAAKAKPAKPAEPAKAAEQPKPAAKPESTGNNEESIPAWLEQSLAREFEYRSQQGFGGPDNFEDYKAQQLKKIKEEEAARAQPSTENLRDRVAERKAAKETTKAEPEKADEAPKADEAAKPKKDTKPKKDAEAKSDPDQPSESTRNAEEVAAEEAARIAAEDPEGVSLAQGQSISLADAARAARERKQALADRAASAARTNKIDRRKPRAHLPTSRRPRRQTSRLRLALTSLCRRWRRTQKRRGALFSSTADYPRVPRSMMSTSIVKDRSRPSEIETSVGST